MCSVIYKKNKTLLISVVRSKEKLVTRKKPASAVLVKFSFLIWVLIMWLCWVLPRCTLICIISVWTLYFNKKVFFFFKYEKEPSENTDNRKQTYKNFRYLNDQKGKIIILIIFKEIFKSLKISAMWLAAFKLIPNDAHFLVFMPLYNPFPCAWARPNEYNT